MAYPIFRVISFNIRSVTEFNKRGGARIIGELLATESPDILFLQETHTRDAADVESGPMNGWLAGTGYQIAASNSLSRSSSGVVAFVRDDAGARAGVKEINWVTYPVEEFPAFEGRVLEFQVGRWTVMNCYGKHSGMHLEKLPARVNEWDVQLRQRIMQHRKKRRQVLVFGDLNIAPEEIDLARPRANARSAGFTTEERASWQITVQEAKLIDIYRQRHGSEAGRYSFWVHRRDEKNSPRAKNVGWRLDTAWCNDTAMVNVVRCEILATVMGSDHAPLSVDFIPNGKAGV